MVRRPSEPRQRTFDDKTELFGIWRQLVKNEGFCTDSNKTFTFGNSTDNDNNCFHKFPAYMLFAWWSRAHGIILWPWMVCPIWPRQWLHYRRGWCSRSTIIWWIVVDFTSRTSPDFPLVTGEDCGKRPDAAAGSVGATAEVARLGISLNQKSQPIAVSLNQE